MEREREREREREKATEIQPEATTETGTKTEMETEPYNLFFITTVCLFRSAIKNSPTSVGFIVEG
jgi:hypothetical protein